MSTILAPLFFANSTMLLGVLIFVSVLVGSYDRNATPAAASLQNGWGERF
jgi:hypothetical protein